MFFFSLDIIDFFLKKKYKRVTNVLFVGISTEAECFFLVFLSYG